MAVTEAEPICSDWAFASLALAPYTAGGAQLLVGVGRLYDQHFEELELALLEAVTKSAAQALERFGLEHQLQRAHEMEAVARLGGDVSASSTAPSRPSSAIAISVPTASTEGPPRPRRC